MKSVDALRELGSQYHDRIIFFKEEFDKCLDAIEEEGKTRYGTEYTDELYQFARRVEEAANDRDDVTLFGVDYTPLPVDADGEPIHVGDVVAATLAHGGSGRWVVDRMELTRAYNQDLWQIALDKDGACWVTPSTMRHHHAPTVEDVLEEFVARWMETHHDDIPALKAEYAAKLRLAGDE